MYSIALNIRARCLVWTILSSPSPACLIADGWYVRIVIIYNKLKIKIKRNRLRFFGKRNHVINETAKITVSCPLHTHKKTCVQYSYCLSSSAILLHCLRQLKCNRRKCNQWICHLQKVKHQPINQNLREMNREEVKKFFGFLAEYERNSRDAYIFKYICI